MKRTIWVTLLIVVATVGLLGLKAASADHLYSTVCVSERPLLPIKVALSSNLSQEEHDIWQWGMHDWDVFDTTYDKFEEVPWVGGPTPDVWIIPASEGGHDRMWVQSLNAGCDGIRLRSFIWSYGSAAFLDTWATHELGHTFGFGDHIQSSLYPGTGYVSPEYCDAPREQMNPEYRGIMTYCDGPQFWIYPGYSSIWDDMEMLNQWYP